MITVKCIQKFKKNNKIYGYRLQDSKGNVRDVLAEQLKSAIKNKQMTVINLTLTSDNRLVDTTPNQPKQSKQNIQPNQLIGRYFMLKKDMKAKPDTYDDEDDPEYAADNTSDFEDYHIYKSGKIVQLLNVQWNKCLFGTSLYQYRNIEEESGTFYVNTEEMFNVLTLMKPLPSNAKLNRTIYLTENELDNCGYDIDEMKESNYWKEYPKVSERKLVYKNPFSELWVWLSAIPNYVCTS